MKKFSGFPARMEFTPVPNLFINSLMPQIGDHLQRNLSTDLVVLRDQDTQGSGKFLWLHLTGTAKVAHLCQLRTPITWAEVSSMLVELTE